jgi:putative ABC transport system permease protein
MLLSLSWKNIWRNKTRSITIIFAIVFGVIGGVGFTAFYNGMIYQRLNLAISNEVSNIQIHNPNFLLNKEINDTIQSVKQVSVVLDSCKKVKSYSQRIKSTAMIGSANSNTGIVIFGVNPDKEKEVTTLYKYIIEGKYLSSDKKNSIVIGQKLAEKLKIKLRSKVVVTLQTSSGDITSAAFKVVGVYKTENTSFDEVNVFVRYDDLSSVIGFNNKTTHEIAISLHSDDENAYVLSMLKNNFKQLSVQSWKEMMPEMGMMTDSAVYMLFIFMVIIFLALSFGIINTMLMAVLDRTSEIGMLMAIGMSRMKIFGMIMLETVLLVFAGSVLGLIITYFLVEIFKKIGIDLTVFATGLQDMGFSAVIYPFLEASSYFQMALLVVLTGIFSSIIPARKALKLKPGEAIRIY